MAEQMNLLGDTAQPEDGELGPVQKAVMRVIRRTETMSWDEAGAIAHAHRGKHSVEQTCEFCGLDGGALLESLIRRGLVVPDRQGFVRVADPTGGHSADFFNQAVPRPVATPESDR